MINGAYGFPGAFGFPSGAGASGIGMMPPMGDMLGMFQMQSQMMAQSAQMLQQLFQQMMACQPPPVCYPMQGTGGLGGYCFPPMPPTSWGSTLPWGGGCMPPFPSPPALTEPTFRNLSGVTINATGVSEKTLAFIDAALSKRGAPYIPGSCGPSGFDCSGLVWRSLKNVGVDNARACARYMQADYKQTAVTREELKPGDLVFFWYPNNRGIEPPKASHIEIYLGDGRTMGTDGTAQPARVKDMDWKHFVGGARVPELQA